MKSKAVPRATRVAVLALVTGVLNALSAGAAPSEGPGPAGNRLTVTAVEAKLAGGEGRLLLPADVIGGFRAKLEADEDFSCFSVNLQEGRRRLWVPLRRDTDAAILIPGGGEPQFIQIELALAGPLPTGTKRVRLLLAEDRSVEAEVVASDRLRIEPAAPTARLQGLEQEELLRWLVGEPSIAWQRSRRQPLGR